MLADKGNMMASLREILFSVEQELQVKRCRDYAPNGLQVEGRAEVGKLVSGVTASLEFIDRALAVGADALLVHHGYFWRGEDACITGMKKKRLQRLLSADVSLLAYHLPLDLHARLGNNRQLADRLGWSIVAELEGEGMTGLHGEVAACSVTTLAQQLQSVLGHVPQVIAAGPAQIRRLGWCTGAAQDLIGAAAALQLDAYISGEISERTVHEARELGIHYLAIGHHASERYGVQALGEWLAARHGIEHQFIDCPVPV